MIIETLTKSQFSDAFNKMGRGEQFSYEARDLIYDYLDELESYELDVVGICCEFAEYENLEEFQNDYGEEYNSMEIIEEATTVLRNSSDSNSFVIVQF